MLRYKYDSHNSACYVNRVSILDNVSRAIEYSINISVGAEWTSLRLYTVKVYSIKRGGHEPTFYLVKDDWPTVSDFYFYKIIETFCMVKRVAESNIKH